MNQPTLLEIRDAPGSPPLLLVRRSADGLAGEVVIATPSIALTIRIPEIVRAFDNVVPAPASAEAPTSAGPWTTAVVV